MSAKQAPPKPPRVRKIKSVPVGNDDRPNEKDGLLSSASPAVPPFKPNNKPAIGSSVAAANLIKALKHAQSVEDTKREKGEDAYIVVEDDLTTKIRSASSLRDSYTSESDSVFTDSIGTVTVGSVKKEPLIPPSFKSKSATPSLSSHREEENDKTSSSSNETTKYSSSKKPLLPPGKNLLSKPHPPLQKSLNRTASSETSCTPPKRNLKLARHQSHDGHMMVAPEEKSRPVLYNDQQFETDPTEECCLPLVTTVVPISPSSVSSGIPEDEHELVSPNFANDNSRRTTPSCITYSEPVSDETMDRGGVSALPRDETDSGNAQKLTPPKASSKSPRPGINQPKVKVKNDNSWIQKRQRDEEKEEEIELSNSPSHKPLSSSKSSPMHSAALSASASPPIPYRSHAILNSNLADKRLSTTEFLMKEKSKPMIGLSGEYYPPAVRSITPEPSHIIDKELTPPSSGSGSNWSKLSVPKVPMRYQKERRSNSFTGSLDGKLRPVSMIDDVFSSRKKENGLEASGSLPHDAHNHVQDKKDKKFTKSLIHQRGGTVKLPASPKKLGFGLFKAKTKIQFEETEVDQVPSGESSEDETGGTIKRMPKATSVRSRESQDDYAPEYRTLFECVFVMKLKENPSTKKIQSEVTYRFPPASDEKTKGTTDIKSLDQFCFPDIEQWKPVMRYTSETYSFVLTDIDGSRRFGYCRRLLPDGYGPRLPEVYCIVSPLGCFDLYSHILDIVEQRRAVNLVAVYSFLKSIIANRFPAPGRSVSIQVLPAKTGDLETIKLKRPPDARLEHVDFTELYNTLGPKKLIHVFSSLVMERRVILAAQRLSTLSSCSHALLALLYPFEWQHTFIPVLPNTLIDFCGSPLPYIIGINPSMIKQLDHLEVEMEDALVVDLDKRKFVKKFGDESSILPSKLSAYLVHILDATLIKNEYEKPDRRGKSRADEVIVNTFMTVFAFLFGNYRDYMKVIDSRTGMKQLQKQDFIQSFHSKSTRRFLEAFMMTQMFDKFIEMREDPVKLNTVCEGLFELKLSELKEKTKEIEIFSTKRRFPWQRKNKQK